MERMFLNSIIQGFIADMHKWDFSKVCCIEDMFYNSNIIGDPKNFYMAVTNGTFEKIFQ